MTDSFARQVLLLSLLERMDARGSWCGETHLQKCVYFLQEGLNVPLNMDFTLYKHGPYSFEMRAVVGEMRGNFLIDIKSRAPYGSSITVGDPGKRLMERFPKTTKLYRSQIDFVADNFAALGVAALERLGTALYVKRLNPRLSLEDQAQKINELKPHIDIPLAISSITQVETILKNAPTAQELGVSREP